MSLPDLPPEWGTIIVPDDAAELDREATQVRRELKIERRRRRRANQPVGSSVVIMAVAVLVTALSLAAVTWGRGPRAAGTLAAPSPTVSTPLTEVLLRGASAEPITIGSLVPAVLLLAEGCDCPALLTELAASLPAGVKLVAVGTTTPCTAAGNLHCLTDPEGLLEARYPAASLPRPAAIVVTLDTVSTPVPSVAAVADLTPLLAPPTPTPPPAPTPTASPPSAAAP